MLQNDHKYMPKFQITNISTLIYTQISIRLIKVTWFKHDETSLKIKTQTKRVQVYTHQLREGKN
jgi:hypothetical protein